MRLHQPLCLHPRRCHAVLPGQQYLTAAQRCQASQAQHVRRAQCIISHAAAPTTGTPENGTAAAEPPPPPQPPAAAAAAASSITATPSSSTAANGVAAATGATVGVDAMLQMQLQMQQQMAQMTAMLQAAQQQNVLLWEQMQQMQQQMQATQVAAVSTSSTAAEAAAAPAAAGSTSSTAAEAAAPATTASAAAAQAAGVSRPAALTNDSSSADTTATPAAAAAGDISPLAAAAHQMRDELQTATAATAAAMASKEAAAARQTAENLKAAAAAAAGPRSKNATAAARPDKAVNKGGKVKSAKRKEVAAGAAKKNQTSSSGGSSSSGTSDVKQQLEQLQKMNEVMAKVLQQKQQEQQQQQQQHGQLLAAEPPAAAAAAAAGRTASAPPSNEQQQEQQQQLLEEHDVPGEQPANSATATPVTPPVAAAPDAVQQQQQQQEGLLQRPKLGITVSQQTAAAAAAALQELKQAQAKQAAAAAAKPPARPAATAAAASRQTAGAAPAAATGGEEAGDRRDVLLTRINNSRSARELQLLFERNQQRLRPYHLAAFLAKLPDSHEGRAAIQELKAAAAAPSSSSSGLSKNSSAVLAFADDLVTMLQLQLGQLRPEQQLEVVQAAAALQLSPRPAWLKSFQAASQYKMRYLSSTQLAGMAAAVATVAAAAAATTSQPAAAAAEAAAIMPSWLRAWMGCAKQQLEALTVKLQQQQQQEGVAAEQELSNTEAATAGDEPQQSGSTAIGQLAAAAAQLKTLVVVPPAGSTDSTQPGNTKASNFVTQSDRMEFATALVAAAAAAATKGNQQQQGLTAAAAADISQAFTELITQQPGLVLQLQESNADLRVSGVLAAVATAAAGNMSGSSSSVLMRLVQGVVAAGVQPDAAWLSEMAESLSLQLRQLSPTDSLTVLQAFRSWYIQPQQQQQQQQDVDQQMQYLLGGLLIQTAAAATTFKPQQITEVLATLGLKMGFRVTNPAHDAAVRDLLAELSHVHNITLLNNSELVQLLQALTGLGVAPEAGFIAAVQRDGVKPRLAGGLKPQEFADVAQALAGLRVQMEYEVLDGYWTELEGNLQQLRDSDRVALLCAIGALRQKPRAQLLGAFMADMLPRLSGLPRAQLCGCLQALAHLQLTKVDTQGVRVTTAQSVPAPADFITELLKHLNPQLAGPEGATAAELASVLQALAALGFSPDEAWLARALDGAVQKLRDAVSAPGGEQTLVNMLRALSQISVKAPPEVLAEALDQLQAVSDRLSAVQISAAMAALKTLDMDPDDQLMGSYLDRAAAAAAAGAATAKDMAAVLQSLSAAGVTPSADWLAAYLIAVRQKLAHADSETLAAIAHATAALTVAGSSSGGSSCKPDTTFVFELVTVANTRLGSSYMDAARILNAPDFKAPFTLSNLADCCWGLVKLGAQPKDLQSMINLLISKSYDRFTQLTVQQLCGSAWAIACCTGSSSGRKGSAAVKLPTKWLNQYAAAAAPGVGQLTKLQLSELVWALGKLYLGADSQYATGSSSGSSDNGSSSSSSSVAGSSIGRSSDVPVQQLLRAVAGQLDSALSNQQQQQDPTPADSFPAAANVSIMVNLLTKFDCFASRRLLQRFCADVADRWDELSDVVVADAAVALAVLAGPGSGETIPAGWLDALSQQIHNRLQSLSPLLLCRCIWALATLQHSSGRQWLSDFAAVAFNPTQVATLQPGDLTDALWALYALERLTESQQQQQQQQDQEATALDMPAATAEAGSSTTTSSSSSSLLNESLMRLLAKKLDKRVNELQPPQILRLLLLAEGALSVAPTYSLPKGVSDGLSGMLSARARLVAESTGVIGLVWAAARLGLRLHISTLDAFCKKIYAQLPSMSARDMARGFWASEKLGYRWLPPQLAEFDRQASLKLPDMSSADVALLLEAYRAFGHAPSQDWLSKFAEMPASSLKQLPFDEAVQLAVQLADVPGGLPAGSVTWLPGWAEGLTAQQLQDMTGQQLFSVVKLLSQASSTTGSTAGSTASYTPSQQLLALLSWAVLPHIATASADKVYCLLCALASWRFVPPNGDVLLSATAARLAEKLPVLSQHQAVQVLCTFANLGFTVGEPLQSKLCDKVMRERSGSGSSSSSGSASNIQEAAATTELLSAVLTAIPNPRPDMCRVLMQQLDGGLGCVPPGSLLKLGQAMAAAGMQWQRPPAAAAVSIPAYFGQQYITAAVKAARMGGLPLPQLAALCNAMQQTGLCRKEDLTTADALTQALQPHLTMALSSSSSGSDRSAALVHIADVASYITDCGYSPAAAVEQIQQLLLVVLRDGSSSSSVELSMDVTADGEAVTSIAWQQQQQQRQQFDAATLAKLLLTMNTWGKRLGGSFATAAFDWSRYRLADANVDTLGPLLLGSSAVCGKPPASWVLDWSAVVLPKLDQAVPEDLTAIGAGLAQVGSTSDLCSSTWMQQYSQAVQRQLAQFTEQQLESVTYSLYCLRFGPSKAWLAAVVGDLERRAPATDTPAARALAYARQLKAI